jgi:hypothetical protein
MPEAVQNVSTPRPDIGLHCQRTQCNRFRGRPRMQTAVPTVLPTITKLTVATASAAAHRGQYWKCIIREIQLKSR